MIEMRINGSRGTSLLVTNKLTSDVYVSYADTEYEKKKKAERQAILDEIERRNLESYNV